MVLSRTHAALKKVDDELQVVWGEVYAPGYPDSQGDYMTAEEIRKMAYGFMKSGQLGNVDINHDNQLIGAYVVESFIAREDDAVFIPNAWVVGVHIPDEGVWKMVKSGELNGFSLEGLGLRKKTVLELEVPPEVVGKTDVVEGHSHEFTVMFGPDGSFMGGRTSAGPDGHVHEIKRGTVTEEVGGHSHRFSFVEGLTGA